MSLVSSFLKVFERLWSSQPEYESLAIGDQIWIKHNLNVSKFRNGDIIPEVKDADEWVRYAEEHRPAWCYYQNDPNNGEIYGKLYNGYAVIDDRGLAPEGWHIPQPSEWTELINYLGGRDVAGAIMTDKLTHLTSVSLVALPAGIRTSQGFSAMESRAGFWTFIDNALPRSDLFHVLDFEVGKLESNSFRTLFEGETPLSKAQSELNSFGLSVRCIKN